MTKDFRKKTKNLMKKLVKEKNLILYKLKIAMGECSKDDVITMCDFLLACWKKMYNNHHSIFFKWFSGFTRELIIEIDLKECFDTLGEIIGATYSEEIIDNLFANFCVGK